MLQLSKSILLLVSILIVVCGLYPLGLWAIGKFLFPFQAQGSMLNGADGKLLGSKLIAQPFTKEEYFQSRPSACAYDAKASASSALAASNYVLKDRIARAIGPIAKYKKGPNKGKLVGFEIETWFAQDHFQGKNQIVSQWATLHPSLAQSWVEASPLHSAYVDNWIKSHPPTIPLPSAQELAVIFFQSFSKDYPGRFPITKTSSYPNGKSETAIVTGNAGSEIQAIFFDMWRQEHPDIELEIIPGDYVMTSASGLDPHITLQNAFFQLDRVAGKWASNLKREPRLIREEIVQILNQYAQAPFGGLAGEKFVNVLEINLELNKRYGSPT